MWTVLLGAAEHHLRIQPAAAKLHHRENTVFICDLGHNGTFTFRVGGGTMLRTSIIRTVVALMAMSIALGAVPSPANAVNDPYGVFVDSGTGERWVTMSPSEYRANAITLDMQARMEALSDGDFKAGADWVFDGTPDPRWDVFQIGDVTRFRSVESKRTMIEYVTDEEVCTRKVSKASNDSLKVDRTARWTCNPSTASTPDSREFVQSFLPLSVGSSAKDDKDRVLMKEGASVPAPGTSDATLVIFIREISLLRSYGLFAGPTEYHEFTTTATNMETVEQAFNGHAWLMGNFVLSTTSLPRLPRIP